MEPTAPGPPPPLAQLLRRKVVQWTLAYAAAAWALVQVVSSRSQRLCGVDLTIDPLRRETWPPEGVGQ